MTQLRNIHTAKISGYNGTQTSQKNTSHVQKFMENLLKVYRMKLSPLEQDVLINIQLNVRIWSTIPDLVTFYSEAVLPVE